jgi:hypothetical protein
MKALSIRQPWASLIVSGGKDIENRDWSTIYRGIVAVHSSAKMAKDDMESACDLMRTFIAKFSADKFKQDSFPLGAILGTVEIVGCVEESNSPWFYGRYGFVLRNPVAFANPIPCRGALSFWNVPDELVSKMRDEYRAATAMREGQK